MSTTNIIPEQRGTPSVHEMAAKAAEAEADAARLEAVGVAPEEIKQAKARAKALAADVKAARARAKEDADDADPARDRIAAYAQSHFRYFRTDDGTVYAQPHGHPVARPIRSQGAAGSHRQELIRGLYRDGHGTFSGTPMKEALDFIEAMSLDSPVQDIHVRVAPCGRTGDKGVTWLDLGRDDGLSVRISPEGWETRVPDPEEVSWRRTRLTGELPIPTEGVGHERGVFRLMELCHFADAGSESLAIAWLLGCLIPGAPVPAPFLTGPQGAGKSTSGRMLMRAIEGMAADLCSPPDGADELNVVASAGWVLAMDNLSHVTPVMSDALARTITGNRAVKREFYTNADVLLLKIRRPVLLTGIDVGVIRADLAERLLSLKLERPAVRKTETELWAEYEEALPDILGSLLDLAVLVRSASAGAADDLRMADFARICRQLDEVTGLGSLNALKESARDLNDDVIEGDLLAQTVIEWTSAHLGENRPFHRETSSWWLRAMTLTYCGGPETYKPTPKGWPATGKVFSDRLKRLQPVLAAKGVIVGWGRTSSARYVEIRRADPALSTTQADRPELPPGN